MLKVFGPDDEYGINDQEVEFPKEILPDDKEEDNDIYKNMYETAIDKFSGKAYRNILFAYREMSVDDFNALKEENNNFENEEDKYVLEEDLTAMCMFGIEDPLREGIDEAVKTCHKAHITVVMCTGDAMKTAKAISLNAGILTKDNADLKYACMEGEDFEKETEGLIPDPELIEEYTQKGKKDECPQVVANMVEFRKIKKNLRVLARSSPFQK